VSFGIPFFRRSGWGSPREGGWLAGIVVRGAGLELRENRETPDPLRPEFGQRVSTPVMSSGDAMSTVSTRTAITAIIS
jgi:hypothetical protein